MSGGDVVPDLTDPWVLAMAQRNHEPEEQWLSTGTVWVTCAVDGQVWPCATRQALTRVAGLVADGLAEWEAAILERDARVGNRPEAGP